jgi:pre-mRNA-splicing factor 38B
VTEFTAGEPLVSLSIAHLLSSFHIETYKAFFIGHQSKTPSSAFCLLLRLLTLRCSEHQMRLLLNHKDSPYIRCVGFLYLRYACEPSQLLKWIQPYFFDDAKVRVRFHVKAPEISIGYFVRSLFQDLDYFGTRLPRLPLIVERDLEVRLRQADQMEERAKKHISNPRTMDYLYTIGNRIRAQYEDDENPLAWYDAVIDRVITADPETGASLCRPKFVVTFSSYGNTETVTLGDIDLPRSEGRDIRGAPEFDKSKHNHLSNNEPRNGTRNSDKYHGTENLSRSHSHRGYNVNRNEKSSSRDRSRSRERDYFDEAKIGSKSGTEDFKSGSFTTQKNQNSSQHEARKRVEEKTPQELAAIAEKRRKLISRYA